LQAGGVLPEDFDTIGVGDTFSDRYFELWEEITAQVAIGPDEKWKVTERVRRLNDLGFDVDEIAIDSGPDEDRLLIQPKIVEAGHYSRKVWRLTGLDVEENQARRILNDIDEYAALHNKSGKSDMMIAHDWLADVYEPTVAAIPPELTAKLEPAELFHEILEHRWFISEDQQRDVPQAEAVASFVEKVLRHRRDESTFLDGETGEIPAVTP
ncbi:DUF4032 domain-containing protein, partial [Actinotignum timonense]